MRGSGSSGEQPRYGTRAVTAAAAAQAEAVSETDAVSFCVRFLAAQARLAPRLSYQRLRSRAAVCRARAVAALGRKP